MNSIPALVNYLHNAFFLKKHLSSWLRSREEVVDIKKEQEHENP